MKQSLFEIVVIFLLLALVVACGRAGPAGPIGPKGAPGQTIQGPVGPSGAPGTGVSTIQFCPGYTTTYPTTFPEYGICIGNNLYAVYYDGKNTWLAEIVPGYYASTSTSAPCDFTVGADCTVSQ
jgi:hypothetical protein